jgi:hypothetical protein
LITPFDSAVINAAGSKSWVDILDYVSSLPYGAGTLVQFPNQTLAKGTIHFYVDTAALCCSMLCARGYTAYMVKGNSSTTDAWVVININGVLYHLDPNYSWSNQQSINFNSYSAAYYVDKNGIYLPATSVNPPASLPTVSPTPSPTPSPHNHRLQPPLQPDTDINANTNAHTYNHANTSTHPTDNKQPLHRQPLYNQSNEQTNHSTDNKPHNSTNTNTN